MIITMHLPFNEAPIDDILAKKVYQDAKELVERGFIARGASVPEFKTWTDWDENVVVLHFVWLACINKKTGEEERVTVLAKVRC